MNNFRCNALAFLRMHVSSLVLFFGIFASLSGYFGIVAPCVWISPVAHHIFGASVSRHVTTTVTTTTRTTVTTTTKAFLDDSGLFCFQGLCSRRGNYTGKIFQRFFIGIGPGRSGSTELVNKLQGHPHVVVGDSKLAGQGCCGPELYVLSSDSKSAEGQAAYVPYFHSEQLSNQSTFWFGEKTPAYADNRLAPFRARAMFGPGLKVFITWRNPLQTLSARYLMLRKDLNYSEPANKMQRQAKAKWAKYTFAQFVDDVLVAHQRFSKCRHQGLRNLSLTEKIVYSKSVSPLATAEVEEYLAARCGADSGFARGFDACLDGFGMFRRWAHVFGRDSILCISLEDMKDRPEWVFGRVADHLSIDQHGFGQPKPNPKVLLNRTFVKLAADQKRFGDQEVERMHERFDTMQRVIDRATLPDDVRIFHELCKQ